MPTKQFSVHHWDTFDNETFKIGEFDSQEDAESFVAKKYEGRIRPTGADQVDIVDDKGTIVKKFKVS